MKSFNTKTTFYHHTIMLYIIKYKYFPRIRLLLSLIIDHPFDTNLLNSIFFIIPLKRKKCAQLGLSWFFWCCCILNNYEQLNDLKYFFVGFALFPLWWLTLLRNIGWCGKSGVDFLSQALYPWQFIRSWHMNGHL